MDRSMKEKISRSIILVGVLMFFLSIGFSYFLFIPKMEKEAIDSADNTNTEVVQQINTLVSFVQDYTENLALSVAQNQEILRYFTSPAEQNRNIASLHLNNLISYEGTVRCVMISDGEVPVLDSLNKIAEADRELLKSDWYENLKETQFGRGISRVYEVEINNARHYTAAYMKNFYHSNKKYTYVVFINLDDLIRNFKILVEKNLDYAAIADSEKNIFYMTGDEKWKESAEETAALDKRSAIEDQKGGIRFVKTSLNGKWRVISYVADRTIFLSFSFYVIGIMIVLFLFTLITLFVLSKAIGNIIKPLGWLTASMKEVAKGNLDCQVEIASKDEIGLLSHSFNKMTVDLKDSLNLIAEKEKQEQQIKFSLLISQIDPHFIYNTINSINYLARKERCSDIIIVNSALISILQDRLRINDIQFTDTIENEMKVVEQYIVIERYMYEGDLKLVWEIDESLYQEQIPKNMIQPLVENALFHGLIDEESGELKGQITISIRVEDGDFVLRVKDDGLGMDEERLQYVREQIYRPEERGKRIGLSNIGRRLYYLYGSGDCIRIESRVNEGTTITLRFKGEYFHKKDGKNVQKNEEK